MGTMGNENADQEAKKYAAVSPTLMTKGYKPLLTPAELIGRRKIKLGRKNVEKGHLTSYYNIPRAKDTPHHKRQIHAGDKPKQGSAWLAHCS